jgi:cytochrome c peroxidase
VDALVDPAWVTDVDSRFSLHDQPFRFGAAELRGLRAFLATPADAAGASAPELAAGGVGNCVACHVPPEFTDYALHNTGVSQEEYDGVWGEGAFAALAVPDLAARDADPTQWLPPTAAHPDGLGGARAIPDAARPGAADLGAWAIFANADHPDSEAGLATLIDGAYGLTAPTDAERLDHALALFKTPSLRDLVQSAPYLHSGAAGDLPAVLAHYRSAADAQRAGTLRNGDPRLAGVALTEADLADVEAFLLALTEDYD